MAFRCWAEELGDCGGGPSGEHVVSECLWGAGTKITVEGFSFCRTLPREISATTFTRNMLCRDHNSGLSIVDAEGGRAFRQFTEIQRMEEVRRKRGRPSFVLSYEIDGPLLERWFLKTTINILHDFKDVFWFNGSPNNRPPKAFVDAAFGLTTLKVPLGLWLTDSVGKKIRSEPRLNFVPVLRLDYRIIAAEFQYAGWGFTMFLDQTLPAKVLWTGQHIARSEGVYRLNGIKGQIGGIDSHFVKVKWPDRWTT